MRKSCDQRIVAITLLLFVPILAFGGGVKEKADPIQAYLAKVDVRFAYDVALEMSSQKYMNSELGGRNAGSDAEHAAADRLVSIMRSIGLKNVRKDGFSLDRWQFNGAELSIVSPSGEGRVIKPYSYASGGTPAEGITAELVYVGTGTMLEYEGIDVAGKIVLIDLNQWDNWWVTWPSLEANFQGAAAIINSCDGGYAQLNDDTMNCQDFCGPVIIPSVNISVNDANYLKDLLAKGSVIVTLKVDNVVEHGGTAYNIVGEIPGRNADEIIIVGDHYDTHFWGFQDNSCAVGLTLAIAKGIIDARIKPERTIVFVLHAAEEWGAIDTRYDWSIGAWNQVFKVRPEWSGKALTYINFELPAYEFAASTSVAATPELWSYLAEYIDSGVVVPEGCFPEGVREPGQSLYTWSDDWSYSIAGIPAMINGFLFNDEGERYPFYENYYHSQFDLPDTYNESVLAFNLKFYGALALSLDRDPALALDFTHQADRFESSVDPAVWQMVSVSTDPLLAEIAKFRAAAERVYGQASLLNERYAELVAKGVPAVDLVPVRDAARAANREYLRAYKAFQDRMTRLDWADTPIFGHEQPQENLLALSDAAQALKKGEVNRVLDEILWTIEDEWYSYNFSKPVVERMTAQVTGAANADNLYWGKGRIVGSVVLYDLIQDLYAKYDTTGEDFSSEIEVINGIIADQTKLLAKLAAEETAGIAEVRAILEKVDYSAALAAAEKLLN